MVGGPRAQRRVGNLVCTAIYDLGQEASVVALAVTEGEDKPLKCPVMFRQVDLVVVTKIDLLPHLPRVSLAAIEDGVARTSPTAELLALSAETGEGIEAWLGWLVGEAPAPGHVAGSPSIGASIFAMNPRAPSIGASWPSRCARPLGSSIFRTGFRR